MEGGGGIFADFGGPFHLRAWKGKEHGLGVALGSVIFAHGNRTETELDATECAKPRAVHSGA